MKMTWLEIYIIIEMVMQEASEQGETSMSDAFYDILDEIWKKLNKKDYEYLRNRKLCQDVGALDKVPMPTHIKMLWGPKP